MNVPGWADTEYQFNVCNLHSMWNQRITLFGKNLQRSPSPISSAECVGDCTEPCLVSFWAFSNTTASKQPPLVFDHFGCDMWHIYISDKKEGDY